MCDFLINRAPVEDIYVCKNFSMCDVEYKKKCESSSREHNVPRYTYLRASVMYKAWNFEITLLYYWYQFECWRKNKLHTIYKKWLMLITSVTDWTTNAFVFFFFPFSPFVLFSRQNNEFVTKFSYVCLCEFFLCVKKYFYCYFF